MPRPAIDRLLDRISARTPWRALACAAGLHALRLALLRRVPVAIDVRVGRVPAAMRRWRASHPQDAVVFYALLTALTVWLALGPPGGLWQHVYDWPGFSFIRVPSRFTLVSLLGIAVLAGIGFERLTARLTPRVCVAITAVAVVVLVAEYIAVPLEAAPYRVEVPPVDRWLDSQPKPFAVAEVPGRRAGVR